MESAIIFSVISFLCLLAHSSHTSSQNLIHPDQDDENINTFILAGQSNMAGQGGVYNGVWDREVPPECRPSPLILRLSHELVWEEAKEPLHQDMDNRTYGVGPGMSFSNAVLESVPNFGEIGLVPCAVLGTKISQWMRGSRLYHQLVTRAQVAVSSGGILRGILWYQGESDSYKDEDVELYKSRLIEFFTDVRSDLGIPDLPIIQVALASGGDYKVEIREIQLGIDLPYVKTVDADGLELKQGDKLHLSTKAQVQLGGMMADAFLQFLPLE